MTSSPLARPADEPTVLVESHGPVRHVVLNRPRRHNAQTTSMWTELSDLGTALANDPSVRCVVISGAGRSFSSGVDLSELRPGGRLAEIGSAGRKDPEGAAQMVRQIQATSAWPRSAPFPVVAAVRGVAMGAGLELALACDIRFVASDARLSLPEVPRGTVPDLGGCHALRGAVGYERALDLVITGREISGLEAAEIGLALRHVPDAEVEAVALDYADAVARSSASALSCAKQALTAADNASSLATAAQGMVIGLGEILEGA